MHRIWKRVLCTVFAVTIISACVPVGFAIERNPATDWFSGKYGIDGPVVNLDMTDYENFNASVWDYDVEYAMKVVEETGADYLLMSVMYVAGVMPAPNPVWDEITGAPPGWYCSTRDLIEEMYQALNARGKKLMLYATADGPWKCPDVGKLGTGFSEEYFKNWHRTIRYFSEKYEDKIAGWWIDGAYDDIGYNKELLGNLEAACKAGNPNAIVTFNNGYHIPYDNRDYAHDYTAGETYGLDFIPDGRWINGIQFHKWIPVYEYGRPGGGYAANQLAQYVKDVTDQGGTITFALAYNTDPNVTEVENADWSEIDPMQLEILSRVKSYVKEGAPLPNSFDGSEKIAAGSCTEMSYATGAQANNSIQALSASQPRILTTGRPGGGIDWYVGTQNSEYPITKGNIIHADRDFIGMYTKYGNVTIPPDADNLAIAVKDAPQPPLMKEGFFKFRLDVRLGGLSGIPIASISNCGGVDYFQFTKGPVDGNDAAEGYRVLNIPIDVEQGVKDIYLTLALWEPPQIHDAFSTTDMLNFIDVNGKVSVVYNKAGLLPSSFHSGRSFGYNVDFGDGAEGLSIYVGNQAPWAGQRVDLYIDGPNAEKGGELIGSFIVPDTGGFTEFKEVKTPIKKVTGKHMFYVTGVGGDGVAGFQKFKFSKTVPTPSYADEAQKLHDLGLYQGIDKNRFDPDLSSPLDRQTGLTMLMRIWGKKQEIQAMTDVETDRILSAFKDRDQIETWAKPYVAYAFKSGVTTGVAPGIFDASAPLSGNDYSVLLLRLLGFDVGPADFADGIFILAEKGGLTVYEAEVLNRAALTKNELVGMSYKALFVKNAAGITPISVITGEPAEDEPTDREESPTVVSAELSASAYDAKSTDAEDILRSYNDGQFVSGLTDGKWLRYNGIDFGSKDAVVFEAVLASEIGGSFNLTVHLDDPETPPVASLEIPVSGGWQTFVSKSADMEPVTGIHDVYLRYDGPVTAFSLKSFRFLSE